MAERQVSAGRKGAYYFGMVLTGVGVLLFLSVFVSVAMRVGRPVDFGGRASDMIDGGGMMLRAVSGMIMIVVGRGLMRLGRVGLAGSGIVLDPEQARTDVEPWARMAGGVVSDALDEASIKLGGKSEIPFDEKLRRLHKLYEDGILDEAEYQREKRELLAKN